ncbi:MAG: hypothetical protein K5668_01960 [Lachnospiraceae bacterium]|nr:hypothetical protein [Lachnospiraceae bacterium]
MKKSRTAETIVITKWTGLKGSALIAEKKEEELLKYFSPCFVDTVKDFGNLLSNEAEEELLGEYGIGSFREIREGGVYGALWDMAEERDTGISVYLKDIPIKQETIEIANYLDFDPYLLLSYGSYLIFTDRGYELMRALREKGLPAAMIGETTDNNDRVVINNGSRRFLSPRYEDALNSVILS